MIKQRCIRDLSCGLGVEGKELKEIFNKIRFDSYVKLEHIHMMTERGIPILQGLSQMLGITFQEVNYKIVDKNIKYSDIESAINYICQPGGRFYNIYKKAHESNLYKLFKR